EPLDLALGKELVHGQMVVEDPEVAKVIDGFRFDYTALPAEETGLSLRTTAMRRAFEKVSTGKWRYMSRLARGETSSFRRNVELVRSTPRTAQVHFALTNRGTIAYITWAEGANAPSKSAFPNPAEHLEVLSMRGLTLEAVCARMIDHPDGWF